MDATTTGRRVLASQVGEFYSDETRLCVSDRLKHSIQAMCDRLLSPRAQGGHVVAAVSWPHHAGQPRRLAHTIVVRLLDSSDSPSRASNEHAGAGIRANSTW